MKWIATLLLLANVAYFTWEFNRRLHEAPAGLTESLPAGVPSLELLQELEELPPLREQSGVPDAVEAEMTAENAEPDGAAPAADVESESAEVSGTDESHRVIYYNDAGQPIAAPPAAPAKLCLEFGPIASRDDFKVLRQWLADRAVWTRGRSDSGERLRTFWVYLEPEASEIVARDRIAELARKGVSDYMLIRKGDLKNAISLGVFSSQESVNRRLAEMSDQGYRPVVVPRYEAEQRYWIAVGLAEPSEFDPLISDLPIAANGHQRPCAEIAVEQAPE